MSHSRIFELSKDKIDKDDYLTASYFDEGSFVGEIAEYTSDSEDRDADIDWLKKVTDGVFEITKDGKVRFLNGGKVKYFANRYNSFMAKVRDMTIEQFSSGSYDAYVLREIIDDKFSFYVYADNGLDTLDSFIRDAAEGTEYYIGGIVDYKF